MLGEGMGSRYGMGSPVSDAVSGMAGEAGDFANKYGPDTLGIVGSGLQMAPYPGMQIAGKAIAGVGAGWGGINAYRKPTAGSVFFSVQGLFYAPHPIFGITRGVSSLLYSGLGR